MSDAPPAPAGFRRCSDVRVRFAETDAQGVVYHSNFLVYCEVARVDYWRALYGDDGRGPFDTRRGWDMVIVHAACDYRASARFDDRLRVFMRLETLGERKMAFAYKIVSTDGTLICDARTVQVAIDLATRKAIAIPDDLRRRLLAFDPPG